MRLFVSVDLPEALADALRDLQEPLRGAPGVRLTDPTQAHVTLSFLGDVDPDLIPDLEDALVGAVAGHDAFEVRFGGFGVFPSREYITVVWVGVEAGEDPFTSLQADVDRYLADLGFSSDEDSFVPHITLGRVDDARSKEDIQRLVEDHSPTVGSMRVTDVRLTESTLTAEGPVYETVTAVPLE